MISRHAPHEKNKYRNILKICRKTASSINDILKKHFHHGFIVKESRCQVTKENKISNLCCVKMSNLEIATCDLLKDFANNANTFTKVKMKAVV